MVLKIIIFVSILFSQLTFAKKSSKTIYFKRAQKYYVQKKYSKSISMLRKYYQVKKPSKLPTAVIQLLALNYIKIKKYKTSSKYFHYVIRRRYRKIHKKVVRSLKSDTLDDIEVPDKLLRIYYHLGQSYYEIYTRTKRTPYFRAAEKYFNICETKEHLDDNAATYLETLSKLKEEVAKEEFSSEWFANIGTLNWQEKLELVNTTSGKSTTLLSNARALCLGGGYRYANAFHGIEISGCGFSGSAQVASSDLTQAYSQDGVAVTGLLLDSGYIIKPGADKTSFTISLPLFYRDGDYTQPENYTILGKGQLSAGVMVKARYQMPYLDFTTSIGNLGWTNIFMMQAGYTF